EQLQGAEADARSDIFSLGCVLYEVVTGQRPFQGKTQVSLMAAILEHEPPPIAEKQPLTPSSLEHVIGLCLAKNPDDRWQSAHDVALALRQVTDQPATVAAAKPSRRGWLWPTMAAAAILIAAGASWKALRPAREITFAMRASIPVPEAAAGARGGLTVSLSPDGHYLLYSAFGEPKWLRPLDGEAYPIPGSEQWSGVQIWSPDSHYLAFLTPGKLQKAPLAGGPTESICTLADRVFGGAWGSNGVLLLATENRLLQDPANGGKAKPVMKGGTTGGVVSPQFHRDG